MKQRIAHVNSARLNTQKPELFNGKIEFDIRKDVIYYTWTIRSPDGTFLGTQGQSVSFKIIHSDEDKFEYSLKHAIENINRTRYKRRKAFKVEDFIWEK